MTVLLYARSGITVNRYVGVRTAESATRKRWQITNLGMSEYVTLSWEQLAALIEFIALTSGNELLNGQDIEDD